MEARESALKNPSHKPLPRGGNIYREGQRAYLNGIPVDSCPYRMGDDRRRTWMTGWYDDRMKDRLGELFIRNRIEWP